MLDVALTNLYVKLVNASNVLGCWLCDTLWECGLILAVTDG
jgi:hypothetical protein